MFLLLAGFSAHFAMGAHAQPPRGEGARCPDYMSNAAGAPWMVFEGRLKDLSGFKVDRKGLSGAEDQMVEGLLAIEVRLVNDTFRGFVVDSDNLGWPPELTGLYDGFAELAAAIRGYVERAGGQP